MALKEIKVFVTSGKKAGVRNETDAVSGTNPKIVHKNQNTLPPRLLSQPYHEVEVCRGREVSEAKVTMGPFFNNRADIIWKVLARDRFVNNGSLSSVSFTKQNRVAKPGISVCSRHHKVDEQPNKKTKKGSYSNKRRESDDKNAVVVVKIVPQLGSVSQDSEALVSQKRKTAPEKPDARSLGTDSKSTVHSVHATSSEYPGKGPSLGKINVNIPYQRSSYALNRSHEVWEARPRPGCQGPQRKCVGYLSTTSRKSKVSGSRKSRVIREMMRKEKK